MQAVYFVILYYDWGLNFSTEDTAMKTNYVKNYN